MQMHEAVADLIALPSHEVLRSSIGPHAKVAARALGVGVRHVYACMDGSENDLLRRLNRMFIELQALGRDPVLANMGGLWLSAHCLERMHESEQEWAGSHLDAIADVDETSGRLSATVARALSDDIVTGDEDQDIVPCAIDSTRARLALLMRVNSCRVSLR